MQIHVYLTLLCEVYLNSIVVLFQRRFYLFIHDSSGDAVLTMWRRRRERSRSIFCAVRWIDVNHDYCTSKWCHIVRMAGSFSSRHL